jgi:hypothetical protein
LYGGSGETRGILRVSSEARRLLLSAQNRAQLARGSLEDTIMLMRRENARLSGAASAVLGGTFLIAAIAHATDGFSDAVVSALPATLLGVVSGIALLVAAVGLLSDRVWGWKVGLGAHLFAIGSVLLGLISVAVGYGDGRPNLIMPIVMLALLGLSLLALWRSRPRNPLRRAQHNIAARMY